jgi:hypothetical protein
MIPDAVGDLYACSPGTIAEYQPDPDLRELRSGSAHREDVRVELALGIRCSSPLWWTELAELRF